jgi:hypothetical protein
MDEGLTRTRGASRFPHGLSRGNRPANQALRIVKDCHETMKSRNADAFAHRCTWVEDGKFVQELRTGTSVDLHGIAFGGDRGIQKVELISTRKRAGRKRRSWILQRRFHGVSGITVGCHLRPASRRSQCVRPTEPVRCRSQKIPSRFRKAPPVCTGCWRLSRSIPKTP